MSILVFDSGIGGLTVLREARVLMPYKRYIYVADDEGFPYGGWPEEALTQRIVGKFAGFLERHQPELAIIACNTASTLALGDLREAYPGTPFVGTVPAIKPAAERTRSRLVSVLATPGTVKREYTRDLIRSFARQCHVRLVGSRNLATLAEAHIRGDAVADDDILGEIAPCFVAEAGARTDIVVLACTHYPFLANVFRRLAPWPVDWLDPAEAIARRALSLVEPSATMEEGGDLAIFTSGNPGFSTERLMSGFGLTLDNVRDRKGGFHVGSRLS